jgi:hypothetical protein
MLLSLFEFINQHLRNHRQEPRKVRALYSFPTTVVKEFYLFIFIFKILPSCASRLLFCRGFFCKKTRRGLKIENREIREYEIKQRDHFLELQVEGSNRG